MYSMENTSRKRYLARLFPLPQSIFMRFVLIIVIPILLAQLIAVYIFYGRHWSTVSDRLDIALANEIGLLVHTISISEEPAKESNDSALYLARRYLFFVANFYPDQTLTSHPTNSLEAYEGFSDYLQLILPYPYHLYDTNNKRSLAIDVQLPKGVLHIETTRKRLATPTTYIFILWMTGTTLLFLIISIIFMRNQIRPIIRLARAAEKFGKGQPIAKIPLEGAKEIRQATGAFLEMKTRIDRLISQRAEMLAGVSHDLRTPITRMKLQLAMAPSSQETEDLKQDISTMETMIQGYLDFAKNGTSTVNTSLSLPDFLSGIIAAYRNELHRITLHVPEHLTVTLNPDYCARIIRNVLDNALRYASHVILTASTTLEHMLLTIDDDGPGIPSTEREEVFRPFYRLDQSRNLETGGVGLGLSVVRDLVARCGGDIHLSDSPQGGLRVSITLPL